MAALGWAASRRRRMGNSRMRLQCSSIRIAVGQHRGDKFGVEQCTQTGADYGWRCFENPLQPILGRNETRFRG